MTERGKDQFKQFPDGPKALNNWVCWKIVEATDAPGTRKIPIDPKTGKAAKSNGPDTWGTFDQAVKGLDRYACQYPGIMFQKSIIWGLDIDHCIDPNGTLSDEAADIIETMDSYTEISPSGTGVHIIAYGQKPDGGCRKGNVEMYDAGRGFTVTGNSLGNPRPVRDCTSEQTDLLLTISAATIDRLLRIDRSKVRPKGRCTTRPGSVLLHQIQVKTFSQWDDTKPGYFAMDWVAFCGESLQGEFVYVLSMTDISTGWVVLAAFMGRSELAFTEAINMVKRSLPFPLSGIHVDNDSTFINNHVFRFCTSHQITMTHSRPNKSNDNCFVEQKNWDVVRKNLGYLRFDTKDQLEVIRQVLPLLAVYQNVFQPSMRLLTKQRDGAKVHKTYAKARTPLQQLLDHDSTPPEMAYMLQNTYAGLSPALLRKPIDALLTNLDKLPQK